jgi:catechol 2,3-dioxygenase-like lactoylglutathione lyase family enzyme
MCSMNIGYFCLPCRDQDEARDFYVDTLGFELEADIPLEEDIRWLTVKLPGQDVGLALMPAGAGKSSNPELARRIAETLALGGWLGGVIRTDDIYRDHAALVAKGVEFTEDPVERFYGIDSGFRDPSGVPWRLTQVAPVPAA